MGYYPFRNLCKAWLSKAKIASKHKEDVFGDDAKEAMLFFNGPHDWMFENEYARKKKGGYLPKAGDGDDVETIMPPSFRLCVNKVSEMRDLLGPSLYHQNPNIIVEAHDPPVPPPQALGIVQPPPDPRPPVMTPMGPQPPPPTPQEMMFQQQMQQYQMVVQQQQDEATVNGFRADLLQYVLNFMQFENDKKTEMRRVIDEAIIKGMGLFKHEVIEREGVQGKRIVSSAESVDNLVLDPDAEKWSDLWWTAIRCVKPTWEWEKEFNLRPGSLDGKGSMESFDAASNDEKDKTLRDAKAKGYTNDLMVVFKFYSKMGMGERLAGDNKEDDSLDEFKNKFDEFGPYCYLCVAEGVPYFLNLPPHLYGDPEDDDVSDDSTANSDTDQPDEFELPRQPVMEQTVDPLTGTPGQRPQMDPETGEPVTQLDPQVFLACQWPIPLWADGGWMFTPMYFRPIPGQVWPMSVVKPGIGWLRLINWIMSFLAVRVRRSCITTIGILASVDEDIVKALLNGKDFQILKLKELTGKKWDEIISILQYPDVGQDLHKLAEYAIDGFAKATGLNEVLYGQTVTHDRSAAESQGKQQATMIRPDDMANVVEDVASMVARREAMALRWLWQPEDALPIVGQLGAQAWANLIQSTSIDVVAREFGYRVEAGTARKPNKQGRIEQMNEVGQSWGAFLTQYTFQTHDFNPINAVLQAWGKANDVPMPLLQPPPPAPPGPPGPPQGGPPKQNGKPPSNRVSQHIHTTNGTPTMAQGGA